MQRTRAVIVILLVMLGLLIIFAIVSNHRNSVEIRARYAQMRAAFSSHDTNGVLALIDPATRSDFDGLRFMRMDRHLSRPLDNRSIILVIGNEATVWPKPNWFLCGVVPVGNTVDMIRVNGRWFFTGNVHLD